MLQSCAHQQDIVPATQAEQADGPPTVGFTLKEPKPQRKQSSSPDVLEKKPELHSLHAG